MAAGRTVLIVEDDPQIAGVLTDFLSGEGYPVLVQPDERAVEAALADPPDLVLLDVMLPGRDGLEVFRRLKADPRTRRVPVIFISALSTDTLKTMLDTNLHGYPYEGIIHKPFDLDTVLATVQRHLT